MYRCNVKFDGQPEVKVIHVNTYLKCCACPSQSHSRQNTQNVSITLYQYAVLVVVVSSGSLYALNVINLTIQVLSSNAIAI